jgi:peroxiredoxin
MSTHTPDQDHVPPTDSSAPDFRLESAPGQTVSLHCLRGQLVILAFYPGDWRPVCGDQLQQLQEYLPQIEAHGAQLLAISVDSSWSHQALARTWGLSFPLLADFEPKGAVARAYGVYRAVDGTSERALFLIDRDGVMRWRYVAPIALDPGVDGLLTALERFQSSSQP